MGRLEEEEDGNEHLIVQKFNHFSHEHPLIFTNSSDGDPAGRVITCSGCNINIFVRGKGYYTCLTCPTSTFALHATCYKMPRQVTNHPAESGHDLILFSLPSFDFCKACGDSGSGFCYVCRICCHNYHALCMRKPPSVSYDFHACNLKLEFSPPYHVNGGGENNRRGFRCDVCQKPGSDHWLYRCGMCEFDAHLICALSNQPPAQIDSRTVSDQ